jgi:hypothetical protein
MSYNYSYNVLINRLEAFAAGHFLIRRFTHGQIDMSDQLQDDQYPFMHVTPDTIEPVQGAMNFGFHIMFADIPRDKEYKAEYQREVISDCIRLGQDLIAEVKNGLELFGFDVQLLETPTFEPFMEEQKNTVTGIAFTIKLAVPWDWSACDIPAIWSVGGASGSGGSGTGYGITLETNGVENVVQTLLNLVEGTNITITDNGNGSVTIDSAGGIADYVSTAYNANHTTAAGNQYVIGDRVWYNGNVYQCIANNDAILPTNTSYWTLVSAGFRLRQTPVDWNASTGDFQILNKPTIPAAQVNSDWNASSGLAQILNKPTIPAAQVNSDWTAASGVSQILNKPTLATVATSGSYTDLINQPTIPAAQIQSDWTQGNTAALDFIKNKPTIVTPVNADWAAISGLAQILNKPTIPAAQIQSDWNQSNNAALDFIKNKPTIPTTLDSLSDVNTPAPTNGQVLTYNTSTGQWIASTPTGGGGSGTVTSVGLTAPAAFSVTGSPITTSGTIAITAAGTSAQYVRGDGALTTFPTIPPAQVNSDWNAVSGVAEILNKPTIPSPQGLQSVITTDNKLTTNNTINGNLTTLSWQNNSEFKIYPESTGFFEVFIGKYPPSQSRIYITALDASIKTQGATTQEFKTDTTTLYIRTPAIGAGTAAVGQVLTLANASTGAVEYATPAGGGTVTSVALTVPSAFNVTGSPITTAGTLAITGAGTSAQYVRGDGQLATTPTALPPNGAASGDLTGSYPNPTVHRVHSYDMQSGLPADGDTWVVVPTPFGTQPVEWRHQKLNVTQLGDTTTVGQNIAKLTNPSAIRFLRINADNTVTARTDSEMRTDLGITTSSTSILYQSQNATNTPASSTYFGCLFGGALSIVSADTLRRTPIATAGTLTKLYVQTSTAQPASGSLVCTVRKNSVDQALTLTIAAGSAAGVFTDLVNSVTVAAGDLLGMKFQNNATAVSANVLSNQVILSI